MSAMLAVAESALPESGLSPAGLPGGEHFEWENRNCATFEAAQVRADMISELTGEDWHACDSGRGVFPRFTVRRMPKVGDLVSSSLNGDTSPDGTIVRITPTFMIVTSTGSRYRRRGQSGTWKNGCWCLTEGHVTTRNESF